MSCGISLCLFASSPHIFHYFTHCTCNQPVCFGTRALDWPLVACSCFVLVSMNDWTLPVFDLSWPSVSPACQMISWCANARSSISWESPAGSGWSASSVSPASSDQRKCSQCGEWRQAERSAAKPASLQSTLFALLTLSSESSNCFFFSAGISECFKQKKLLAEVCPPPHTTWDLRTVNTSFCWIKAAWWSSPCGSLRCSMNLFSTHLLEQFTHRV